LDERRLEIGLESFYCWVQRLSSSKKDAALVWPAGVLFVPSTCKAD
jgi:hypothetical protein